MHPEINIKFMANKVYSSLSFGAVGYILGHLIEANPLHWAGILAISSLAQSALSFMAGWAAESPLELKRLSALSRVAVNAITVIVLVRLNLLSAQLAKYGMCLAALGLLGLSENF